MEKRYLVIEPSEKNKRLWRLRPDAEAKVGQIGTQVDSSPGYIGQVRQRLLRFGDGSTGWFAPCWLKHQTRKLVDAEAIIQGEEPTNGEDKYV